MFKQHLVFSVTLFLVNSIFSFRCVSCRNCDCIDMSSSTTIESHYDTGYYYATNPFDNQTLTYEYYPSDYNLQNPVVPQDPFEDDTFVPNKNYLINYYSHLKSNMPKNTMGICGYTAISTFLSFYDSYWHDYFITEQYDSEKTYVNSSVFSSSSHYAYESPGVYNNIIDGPSIEGIKEDLINEGYVDEKPAFKDELDRRIVEFILDQIDSDTFLGKLFQVAINNGIIKSRYIPGCSVSSDYYLDAIGVNNYIMNTVLNGYINTNYFITNRISVVTSQLENNSASEKARIRSEIINIVKSGRPVLMGGNGYNDLNGNGVQDLTDNSLTNEYTFGHVVVAYDYDEFSDTLYGNMGWSSGSTSYYNLDNYFNIQMSDYWALSIENLLPDRPDNYIFTDKNAYYSPYYDSLYNIMTAIHHGFAPSYGAPDTPVNQTINIPYSNETIYTTRQRCGLIEGERVNLSPKRYSPGISFLEYTFDKNIKRLEIQLSWWSNNEMVSPINSTYLIEYSYDGINYLTALDLWQDVTLSTDRTNPTKVVVDFPENVKKIKYYAQVMYPTNDRNKGRLSINKTLIEYYS